MRHLPGTRSGNPPRPSPETLEHVPQRVVPPTSPILIQNGLDGLEQEKVRFTNMRLGFLLLIIPTCLAVAADRIGYLPFKMGVPLVCAALLLICFCRNLRQRPDLWYVVAAFVFSAIGDYFLSNKRGNESYFVIGIAAFFVAHLGYLGFSLCHGRLHRVALAMLLIGYVPYFIFALRPAIPDPTLFVAVLLYLLVSCVGLAAAWGLQLKPAGKWLYVFGILMIVVSDTFISFNEFLKFRTFNDWILPTYYLAHLTVTASVLTTLPLQTGPGDE